MTRQAMCGGGGGNASKLNVAAANGVARNLRQNLRKVVLPLPSLRFTSLSLPLEVGPLKYS